MLAVDYSFGLRQESLVHRHLVEKFGECKKIMGRYAVFDFEGDNFFIEVKSFRNNYEKYERTMIGKNKFDKAEQVIATGADVYFCFNYLDGLYYWKYNKDDLDKIKVYKGGRTDRGKAEIKEYCYIPIVLLTKI